jgi:hypothetical protein
MLVEKFEFNLFADYHQFYLQDEQDAFDNASKVITEENVGDLPNPWTNENVGDLLGVLPKQISVGTARNMTVPVIVEIQEDEPNEDLTEYDHITQCSFVVPSGKIVIAGCTDGLAESARILVAPELTEQEFFIVT